ncbi:MAG: hypothetical protein WC898_00250 [Candidatus Paceibacterota bacterium]|jgi:hypothetical protein
MNTIQKGAVRCIVFKEKTTWYAVALEFNIVESSDDYLVSLNNLNEAVQGYVESQKKVKGSRVAPLNQKLDKEYDNLWKALISGKKQPIKSPYEVKYFGITKI